MTCNDSDEWFLEPIDHALQHGNVPADIKRRAEDGLRKWLVLQDRLVLKDSGVPGEPPQQAIEFVEKRTDALFRILKNCRVIDANAKLDDFRDRTGICFTDGAINDTGVPDLCRI